MTDSGPNIEEIRALRDRLTEQALRTPVVRCPAIESELGDATEVFAKLEFFLFSSKLVRQSLRCQSPGDIFFGCFGQEFLMRSVVFY